jgi:hypothetical protein
VRVPAVAGRPVPLLQIYRGGYEVFAAQKPMTYTDLLGTVLYAFIGIVIIQEDIKILNKFTLMLRKIFLVHLPFRNG